MPLPVSSQVYMPNPQAAFPSPAQSFEIGKQSNPVANFIQGAMSGYDTGLGWQNTRQQTQERQQQMQWYPKIQERENKRVEALDERNRIAEEARQSNEIWRRDQAERTQKYREDSLKLRATEVNNRAAASNKQSIDATRKQEAAGDEAKALQIHDDVYVNGKYDSVLALVGNDPTSTAARLSYVRWAGKNVKEAGEMMTKLQDAVITGAITGENLSKAQTMIQMLEKLPTLTSLFEEQPITMMKLKGILGSTPEKEWGALTINWDRNDAGKGILYGGATGKEEIGKFVKLNDKESKELQQLVNTWNQVQKFTSQFKQKDLPPPPSTMGTEPETPVKESKTGQGPGSTPAGPTPQNKRPSTYSASLPGFAGMVSRTMDELAGNQSLEEFGKEAQGTMVGPAQPGQVDRLRQKLQKKRQEQAS